MPTCMLHVLDITKPRDSKGTAGLFAETAGVSLAYCSCNEKSLCLNHVAKIWPIIAMLFDGLEGLPWALLWAYFNGRVCQLNSGQLFGVYLAIATVQCGIDVVQ